MVEVSFVMVDACPATFEISPGLPGLSPVIFGFSCDVTEMLPVMFEISLVMVHLSLPVVEFFL